MTVMVNIGKALEGPKNKVCQSTLRVSLTTKIFWGSLGLRRSLIRFSLSLQTSTNDVGPSLLVPSQLFASTVERLPGEISQLLTRTVLPTGTPSQSTSSRYFALI
jgi:hypothetical protein